MKTSSLSILTVPVISSDHSLGREDAPVQLLEYGDFECPYCEQAFGIVARIARSMKNELRYVFRNFPLSEIHPNALNAARAAEAAGLQGRYWEMHELLFTNQESLEVEGLLNMAAELELDLERFLRDMGGAKVARRVSADIESGMRSGVNGTPTFFINGVRHEGDWSYEALLRALRQAARPMRRKKAA